MLAFVLFSFECSSEVDFPLPLSPVEQYAYPQSVLTLDVSPNPTTTGTVSQTWILREMNGVGMRVDSITMKIHNSAGVLTETRKLAEADIKALWESTYIPKSFIASGTIQMQISGEAGGRLYIHLFGHDDNRYVVSALDTLQII